MQELARGWKDDPDTVGLLKEALKMEFRSAINEAAQESAGANQPWK